MKSFKTNLKIAPKEGGYSVLEILVSLGILSIITLAMNLMIANANSQISVIQQRSQATEIAMRLHQLFNNSNYCDCLFRTNSFNVVTNSFNLGITSLPETFTAIPAAPAACTASTNSVIPAVGDKLSSSSSLTVEAISLTDIYALGGGAYMGQLQIALAGGKMQLRPIQSSFFFQINPTGGSGDTDRPLASCGSYPPNTTPGNFKPLDNPVPVLCATNDGPHSWCSGFGTSVIAPTNQWTTVDLSMHLPASAKRAYLIAISTQTNVWVKKAGSPDPQSQANRILFSNDDVVTTTNFIVDVEAVKAFEYARKKACSACSASRVRFQLVGYTE